MQPDRHRHLPLIELTEADAVAVASLYVRSSDYFREQDGEAPTLADARELFADIPPEKTPQDQTVFGLQGDNRLDAVAAILRGYPLTGTWYLGLMIVDAKKRGRGLGRAFYSALEEWAARHGAMEIRLAVLEKNGLGQRFWRSLGFEEIRRVGPDNFKMRKHCRIEMSRVLDAGPATTSAV